MANINQKRVRFFKSIIYAFIVLIMFLPLILMSLLSMRMIDYVEYMEQMLGEMKTLAAQAEPYLEPSDLFEEEADSGTEPADSDIPDSPAPYMTQPTAPSVPPEAEVPEETNADGATAVSEPAGPGEAAGASVQTSGGAVGDSALGYVPVTGR